MTSKGFISFNKQYLVCFCLFFVGMYLVPIRIMRPDLTLIPGDYADARFNNYLLEHGHLFFTGKLSNYWNAPFMYPEKDAITYSDNLLGTLPIYSLFRVIGLDRESAYQGWIILLFALNFITATYALHKLNNNLSLSAVGGYIFAFSFPVIWQMNHAQVFPRFMIPLVFLWMFNFLTTKKLTYFFALCMGIVFEFYAGIYLGFLLTIFVALWMIVTMFFKSKRVFLFQNLNRKRALQVSGISVLALLMLLPLLYPYYERSKLSGTRPYEEVVISIPYIKSYFFTWPGAVLWNFLTHTANDIAIYWDHILFPGGMSMLSMIIFPFLAFKSRKEEVTKNMIWVYVSFLVVLLFTLQCDGMSLYILIYQVPGFSSLRTIGRIIHVELFAFAWITVYCLQWAYERIKHKTVYLLLIAYLCIMDQYSTSLMRTYSKKASQDRVKAIEKKLQENNYHSYNAFAYIPKIEKSEQSNLQLDAMLASQAMGIPTINAYTAACPGAFGHFWQDYDLKGLQQWLSFNDMDIEKDKILLIN